MYMLSLTFTHCHHCLLLALWCLPLLSPQPNVASPSHARLLERIYSDHRRVTVMDKQSLNFPPSSH